MYVPDTKKKKYVPDTSVDAPKDEELFEWPRGLADIFYRHGLHHRPL